MRLFVLCPARAVTGGPEALHQLVHTADRLGFEAAVAYVPADDPEPTAAVYRVYDAPVVPEAVDAADSFVVSSEIDVPGLFGLTLATRGLWWLSVDNFARRSDAVRQATGTGWDAALHPDAPVVHLAQSEYARRYVTGHGSRALMLTDYIRDEIVEASREVRGGPKDDVVVYNPAKGLEFTQALMAAAPHLEFVPLQGLTPPQVTALLGRAKVYIDFGNHPGRDRIPREAALAGACVVTGRRGSAGNDVDVPLPDGFRFCDDDPGTTRAVVERIEAVMRDHRSAAALFAPYRTWVEGQKDAFTQEVFTVMTTVEAHLMRTLSLSV